MCSLGCRSNMSFSGREGVASLGNRLFSCLLLQLQAGNFFFLAVGKKYRGQKKMVSRLSGILLLIVTLCALTGK